MSKKVKKIFKKIAPIASIALPFVAPGLGTVASAAIGAGLGGISGGLKGALTGGATAGLGSYISGGGNIPGLGSIGKNVPLNGYGPSQTAATGILGKTAGKIAGAGAGGGSSLFSGGNLSSIMSSVQASSTNDEMEEELLKQQRRSAAALDPDQNAGVDATERLSGNLAEGFDPGDLTQDPGYQFNLQEGTRAMDRANSARGGYYSGAALKEAANFGQGLADNTYNTAYQRWLQQNNQLAGVSQQGQNAANSLTGIYDNEGNIKSNATLAKNNILQGSLSSLLSGSGARRVIGYKPDGTPIYDDEATASQYEVA